MRKLPFFGGLLALALAGSVHAEAAGAQVRDVVSKEISVARSEASLRLGLSGGEQLDLTLRDGAVTIDDRASGPTSPVVRWTWRGAPCSGRRSPWRTGRSRSRSATGRPPKGCRPTPPKPPAGWTGRSSRR